MKYIYIYIYTSVFPKTYAHAQYSIILRGVDGRFARTENQTKQKPPQVGVFHQHHDAALRDNVCRRRTLCWLTFMVRVPKEVRHTRTVQSVQCICPRLRYTHCNKCDEMCSRLGHADQGRIKTRMITPLLPVVEA